MPQRLRFPLKKKIPEISISIVSHGHGELVALLLADLKKYCPTSIEVILTLNVKETLSFTQEDFDFQIHQIHNKKQKGFGTNHNHALKHARGSFVCVLNPDVRLTCDPFPKLIDCLDDKKVGVAAPAIKNRNGEFQENGRQFPTPLSLLKKILSRAKIGHKKINFPIGVDNIYPDWVSGAFMVFPHGVYRQIGGFNEKYFLYYEDVDLCARLNRMGLKTVLCPAVSALHDGRYDSHRNIKFLKWHMTSALRFFLSDFLIKNVKPK